jgi:hypothetical protein
MSQSNPLKSLVLKEIGNRIVDGDEALKLAR